MENDAEETNLCSEFLRNLKAKGKSITGFQDNVKILQHRAGTRGLSNEHIDQLIDIITNVEYGAVKKISLIKCLVPVHKISHDALKKIITWLLASLHTLQITVAITTLQWIVGLWENGLADRKTISMYYDVFFYWMLRKVKLERYIAQLIYILTKPEDVTRRNVSRLLFLYKKQSGQQKHTTVLLSLFKTYKPELVPERIEAMNVESVWKPIPEVLRLALKSAKDRSENLQGLSVQEDYFNWNIAKVTKKEKKLLPSVGYLHIGPSILKKKDNKSLFDIYNINELGKHHLSVELPCNAISLLANMAGYHLLTYADFHFQSRFAYNLYNTLRRAFILERDKFSQKEMDRLLDMTIQFCRYMQQGMLVVDLFIDEYLYINSGEHDVKILELLEWMTFMSLTDIQQIILPHIKNMFRESSITLKCRIIETFKMLIINIFTSQGFDDCYHEEHTAFLKQVPIDNITDVIFILTRISNELIISGLNAHSCNILLLSEAITFYEVLSELESRNTALLWTLAPGAVIYAAFVSRSCTLLARVCALLARYLQMASVYKEQSVPDFNKKFEILSTYIEDIVGGLWYNKAFNSRHGCFLKSLPTENFESCNFNLQLNLSNHYAILPYKYTITREFIKDVIITTNEEALTIAEQYYPAVSEFLKQVIPELQEEETI